MSVSGETDLSTSAVYADADYRPVLSNWYTAKPYGFKFTPRGLGQRAMVMYLPISPSNLSITTPFATSVVPTLYGTVEEHSPVRYYDISIEGTTGMGPRYVQPFPDRGSAVLPGGRSRFTVQQTIRTEVMKGFFMKTLTAAENIYSETKSLLGPMQAQAPTGLQLDQTGYLAFHNLYRFLLKYKKSASGVDKDSVGRPAGSHPLIFFNYKDNNQYKVAIRAMSMRRDKEDPMMYHYSITMRGYDLESADTSTSAGGDEELLRELGLDGVNGSSLLGDIKKKANQARGILASVGNGINNLGR